jgi:hypothetical protein
VGIRAIDRDGGNERWVMIGGGFGNGVGAPLPSPTSDTLALASGGAIEFFDPRTGASRWYRPSWPADHPCSLRPSDDPCSLEIGTPSWSPDGKRLIFSSDCRIGLPSDPAPCPGESAGMSILDVETLERRTLPVEGLGPVWSPDGRKIAFWRTETDPPVPGEPLVIRNTIHVMNADGTDVREVAEGTEPDWQAIPRSDEPSGPPRPPGPPPHRPPVRPNPPAPPSPPPAHVPDGTPPGQPTGGSPSFPDPVPSVGELRISVRAPLRARAGRSVRLVVRFSRPLTGRVRLQERRGTRLVTVAGKRVHGKRVTFAVRPRAGTRVYRIVHATRAKVVRIRVR